MPASKQCKGERVTDERPSGDNSKNDAQDLPVRHRKTAFIAFWGGLAVAAFNPPGQLMALGTIVSLIGAFWLLGQWLNKMWARHVRHRL